MATITIISEYWNEVTIRDGVMQRVQAIDGLFSDHKRVYVHSSYRAIFRKVVRKVDEHLTIIELNPLIHFFYLFGLLRETDKIYIHSVHNLLRILPVLIFNNTKFTLDLHGAFPEESRMNGRFLLSFLYEWVEKLGFHKADVAVFVTYRMKRYYEDKYARFKRWKSVVYFISPKRLEKELDIEKIKTIKAQLGIDSERIVIIYSGNTQVWQNIDMMCESIRTLANKNFIVIILSMEPEVFKARFTDLENNSFLNILSVSPSELPYFYCISHYGYILRDDIIVNNLANPTKLVEYMSYGIVPIVKSPQIGDFYDLGYNYIYPQDLDAIKAPDVPNFKNITIVERMIKENNEINFPKETLGL